MSFNYLYNIYAYLRNFVFPNLVFIFSKRLTMGKTRRFNQCTLFRGKGKIQVGDNCSFGFKRGGFYRGGSVEIQARATEAVITIGTRVSINNNIFICSSGSIKIGDNTMIGQYVTMMDFEAHAIDPARRREIGEIGSIDIAENVWIGNNVIILKNTIIGKNSIVAAGAVVSGNFPNNVIIGGVPAKVIKTIDGK